MRIKGGGEQTGQRVSEAGGCGANSWIVEDLVLKKSFRMMPNSNRLPGDVAIDILSRLPAGSLIRFKCVHKSWYALLQDSKFVALHLRNHTWANNTSLYTLLIGEKEKSFNICNEVDVLLSMVKYDGDVALPAMKDVDLSSVCKRRVFQVCSPCNGIVCFGDYFDRVVIANLGIRQFRALPKSCIPHPKEDDIPMIMRHFFENCYQKTIALGFGIDLQTKDYKVVRISEILGFPDEPAPKYKRNIIGEYRYDVEVYTIGSNSWRQIEDAYPFNYCFCYGLSSYWNGAYYWCACKQLLDGKLVYGICSFNFSDEVFKFITIPEHVFLSPPRGSFEEYGIIEFNGSLAILTIHFSKIQKFFDIWVMDGLGVGSWTKILCGEPKISMFMSIRRPSGFLKKYQLVLIINGQLASYNFVTNQVQILPINDDNQLVYYEGINYKTSLVSIFDHGYHVDD